MRVNLVGNNDKIVHLFRGEANFKGLFFKRKTGYSVELGAKNRMNSHVAQEPIAKFAF